MGEAALLPGENKKLNAWLTLIRQPPPTPMLVGIGLISLLPALLTAGPVVAAVAIWYRGGGRDGWAFSLFFAVLVVMGMFTTAAVSLGTAWRRSRQFSRPEPQSDVAA
ncbi:hypothetical protein VMT65_08400 [Nocardia sp. CDC153]|uniref:hypothetical protein n=1 Tax=Nocardia sp. CDC153 TaxID=3112167 RepID=UPI002DB7A181|nr:hypothetical protein [Nocardia sp. CDC153]MEC3953046.1 hypothetical protein [Nocardia sp. CDC153]